MRPRPARRSFGILPARPDVPADEQRPALDEPKPGSSQSPLRALDAQNTALVPMPAEPISGKILRYADRLIKRNDRNRDGRLTDAEQNGLSESQRIADFDRDGAITADELSRRIVAYGRRRSLRLMPLTPHSAADGVAVSETAAIAPLANHAAVARGPGEPQQPPKPPRRFFVPAKRLPNGLAEWFRNSDADGDGQVTMAEFSSQWTPAEANEFSFYDQNGDGIITAAESLRTREKDAGERNQPIVDQAARATPGAYGADHGGRRSDRHAPIAGLSLAVVSPMATPVARSQAAHDC